jgi:deoxyribonuclease V
MRLKKKPDLLFLDGHGICHPRGLGLASHIGVSLGKPSIGVAKSRLCGDFREPKLGKPESIVFGKRQVGWAFRGRFRPIFISPGNMVSLDESLKVTLRCLRNHRLPEPLRLAHLYAGEAKRRHGNHEAR